ncbi:hypothetical protein HHI36_021955 [Cryptolaemus montrouzieri]|uniref:Uncharacterized protein n=1 Tax=Cryptolaemus montrouzieri TaxID=559131 RepID=A0ABD2MYM3_9CUCU
MNTCPRIKKNLLVLLLCNIKNFKHVDNKSGYDTSVSLKLKVSLFRNNSSIYPHENLNVERRKLRDEWQEGGLINNCFEL